MKIHSPLANFVDLLQHVCQTAVDYAPRLKTNEAATRAALIDPILVALGWDPTKPDMIEFEKTYIDTRVDYALNDSTGKVRAIIEAKALGGNLIDPKITTKLLSYGFTYGIQEIVLTNGVVWQHFSQSTPGNVTPECFDLSKDNLILCADYFIKKFDASRFWLQSPDTSPVPESKPFSTSNINTEQLIDINETFVPLISMKANLHNEPPPKCLQLPNGKITPIHYWRDILAECVQFVLKENPSIPVPLVDKAGKKISLLSYEKSDKKVTIMETNYNGRKLYVHLNYDTNNCIANAIYILGFLPKSKNWQQASVSYSSR